MDTQRYSVLIGGSRDGEEIVLDGDRPFSFAVYDDDRLNNISPEFQAPPAVHAERYRIERLRVGSRVFRVAVYDELSMETAIEKLLEGYAKAHAMKKERRNRREHGKDRW